MTKTLTQNRIEELDAIGNECGYELHMPPFKGQPHPFFAVTKDSAYKLTRALSSAKFDYEIAKVAKTKYYLIKG